MTPRRVTQGTPCPICGGNDRYSFWRKLGKMRCRQCGHEEAISGAATTSTTEPPHALTSAETARAHQGYTAAADFCTGLLWQPEGAAALAELHRRGFTDDTLHRAKIGFHPVTTGSQGLGNALWTSDRTGYDGAKLGGLLGQQGRALSLMQDAVTLPYCDASGTVRLLRTRKLHSQPGKPKYLNPAGTLFAGGTPTFFGHELLSDPKVKTILLTEGEFKALAVTQAWRAGQLSMPAVATPGGSYLPDELLDALSDRTVILAYDVERRSNPFILSAGEQFTLEAIRKLTGAHLERTIEHLNTALRQATKAKDSIEVVHLQAEITNAQASLNTVKARAIRVKVIRLPLGDADKVDLDGYLLAAGAAQLQLLIDQAMDAHSWYKVHGDIPYRYDLASGCILNGTRQMSNYFARVVEDVTVCDGIAETAIHRIAIQSPSRQMREIVVPAEEWSDQRKAMECIRAGSLEATADDEGHETLRAIKMLSRHGSDPASRISYTCIGWQEIEGHWHYLVPDGAITASGIMTTVRAEIDPKAQGNHYALCGDGDSKQGAATYLSFLRGEVCPQPLALMLAAHAALPLVHRFLASDGRPLLFPYGESGSLKSAVTRAGLLALYGPSFTAERTDGGAVPKWDSTYNGLEQLAFTYRDAPLLIDDYKIATSGRDALPRFLHAYSESSSRTRSTKHRSLDRIFPARGIAVVTGEDRPGGDVGQIGRCLFVPVKPGEIRAEPLAHLQHAGAAGHLAVFWRGFVQEIARWLDLRGAVGVGERLQAQLERDDAALPGHLRTAGALRQNRAAWLVLSSWLQQAGYTTADEATALNAAHLDARMLLAAEQQKTHKENRPAEIFLNVLREALSTGEALIVDDEEERLREVADPKTYRAPDPHKIVGFAYTAGIALFPQVAYRFVQDWRARQRQPLNYSAPAIWQQLDSDGLIVQKSKDRPPYYKVRHGKHNTWCLMLAKNVFDGPEESDKEEPADTVPNVPTSSQAMGTAPDGTTEGQSVPVPKVPIRSPDVLHTELPTNDPHEEDHGNNGNNGNNGALPHSKANGVVPIQGRTMGTTTAEVGTNTRMARPLLAPNINSRIAARQRQQVLAEAEALAAASPDD